MDISVPRLLSEIGRPGLKHYSGILSEEWLADLKGDKALRKYREMMDNDPIINAMLFAVYTLMLQADIRIEPGGSEPADMEARDFVEEAFNALPHTWSETLSNASTMFGFGYSICEICYKRDDRKRITWDKWAVRSPESRDSWLFDAQDNATAWVQRPAPSYAVFTLPLEKCLHWRTDNARGNPEGRSLLRGVWKPYFYSQRIETIEAIGLERDLTGLPVMWVPPHVLSAANSVDSAALDNFKKAVRDVRVDEQGGLVMPLAYDDQGHKLYDFALMSSPGAKQIQTTPILQRYAQRMACVMLADFLFLGHEKTGSFALSSDKTELFAMAVGAWLDNILTTINNQAIRRLVALNRMPGAPPRIVRGDIETPNLSDLGTYIGQLAGAGLPLFPNPELEAALLRAASLPQGDRLADEDATVGKSDDPDDEAAWHETVRKVHDREARRARRSWFTARR